VDQTRNALENIKATDRFTEEGEKILKVCSPVPISSLLPSMFRNHDYYARERNLPSVVMSHAAFFR